MVDLILCPAFSTIKDEWALQLRYHDSYGETKYETIAYVNDDTARKIERAGRPYFLFGHPDGEDKDTRKQREDTREVIISLRSLADIMGLLDYNIEAITTSDSRARITISGDNLPATREVSLNYEKVSSPPKILPVYEQLSDTEKIHTSLDALKDILVELMGKEEISRERIAKIAQEAIKKVEAG